MIYVVECCVSVCNRLVLVVPLLMGNFPERVGLDIAI